MTSKAAKCDQVGFEVTYCATILSQFRTMWRALLPKQVLENNLGVAQVRGGGLNGASHTSHSANLLQMRLCTPPNCWFKLATLFRAHGWESRRPILLSLCTKGGNPTLHDQYLEAIWMMGETGSQGPCE